MTDSNPARFTQPAPAMKLTATKVILAGTSRENIAHELLQYDCRLEDSVFVAVVDIDDFNATLALPVDTPWCIVEDVKYPILRTLLRGRFGQNIIIANAVKLLNDQYALDPKRYRL